MAWYSVFIPDLVVSSYENLRVKKLQELSCRVLLVDLDNTLVPHDQELPDRKVQKFIAGLHDAGIRVALISNNTPQRVGKFAAALGLDYYPAARKPLPGIYRRVMRDFQVDKEHFICLGDQLLTDVWGAHNAKVRVIWTYPLVRRDILITKVNRLIERLIFRKLVKKGYLSEKM